MTTRQLREKAAVLALVEAATGQRHRTADLIDRAGSALRLLAEGPEHPRRTDAGTHQRLGFGIGDG